MLTLLLQNGMRAAFTQRRCEGILRTAARVVLDTGRRADKPWAADDRTINDVSAVSYTGDIRAAMATTPPPPTGICTHYSWNGLVPDGFAV